MPYAARSGLLRHADLTVPERIARSAAAVDGVVLDQDDFVTWFDRSRPRHRQRVDRVPLAELRGWSSHPDTGNLEHDSGRFFSVEGVRVRSDTGPVAEWSQPIINQPEIGVLGIAVREIDGVLHCLMQAKAEPGNPGGVQLAPTVQATYSNYTRVHGGKPVPYLEHFRDCPPHRILADVLQSEQGAWFYRKRNRNMVVEVGQEVEAGEDFCWLTLGQLYRLLKVDNLVNMDARTVLSCLPGARPTPPAEPADGLAAAIARSADRNAGSVHTTAEVLSWITGMHTTHQLAVERIALWDVERWHRSEYAIAHELGVFFSVIGVDVAATTREVATWCQPLLQPHGTGMVALLVKRFDGVLHALVNARVEPGCLDVVELAPTVQCTPENYAHLPAGSEPPFLDVVLSRHPEQVRFDVELSEEGGRFFHATSRYQIIEVDDGFPAEPPPRFHWLTLHQLTGLLRHSHYVNVQARTLVAGLRALA